MQSNLKSQASSPVSVCKKLKHYLRSRIISIIGSKHQASFILKLPKKAKVLDIGCGPKSPERAKIIRPDIYYVRIDISEGYNELSATVADEYIPTSGEDFADTIDSLPNDFDAVISSHNLEHCNYPMKTLDAICERRS